METIKDTPDAPSTTPDSQASPPDFTAVSGDARAAVEDLLARLGPKAAFGEAVRHDGVTVIPVAEVRVGFGFGSGGSRDAGADIGDPPDASPEGGGGGGGGGGRVVPRGFVRVTASGARFVPTPDVTRLALAGMVLVALATVIVGQASKR